MSWHKINLALCPGCGRDVAKVCKRGTVFEAHCSRHLGGCGCHGCAGDTEAEAVKLWNAGLVVSGVNDAA